VFLEFLHKFVSVLLCFFVYFLLVMLLSHLCRSSVVETVDTSDQNLIFTKTYYSSVESVIFCSLQFCASLYAQ